MGTLSLRPAQQWVGLTMLKLSSDRLVAAQIGAQKLCAALPGQGGGKKNYRDFVRAEPVEHAVKISIHICVISVALVYYNDLAR